MESGEDRWEVIKDLLNKSPFYCHLDMKVVKAEKGRSRLTLQAKKELRNLYGTIHGGAIASVLDSSCTIALGTLLEEGETVVTLDMRINYISNVSGGVLVGEGRVLHRGNKTGVACGEVRDSEGKLVATGVSTLFINRPQAT